MINAENLTLERFNAALRRLNLTADADGSLTYDASLDGGTLSHCRIEGSKIFSLSVKDQLTREGNLFSLWLDSSERSLFLELAGYIRALFEESTDEDFKEMLNDVYFAVYCIGDRTSSPGSLF
jgi:hypothetical protein